MRQFNKISVTAEVIEDKFVENHARLGIRVEVGREGAEIFQNVQLIPIQQFQTIEAFDHVLDSMVGLMKEAIAQKLLEVP